MTTKSMQKVLKTAKIFNFFVYAYLVAFVLLSFVMYAFTIVSMPDVTLNIMDIHYFFDISTSPAREITDALAGVSQAIFELFNLCFQCCYFNLCLHVESLYCNIYDNIDELNLKSGQSLKVQLVKVLNSIADIRQLSKDIFDCFKIIICLSILNDIATLGIYLTMYETVDSIVTNLSYTPFLFFDIWIYCYTSSLLIAGVRIN